MMNKTMNATMPRTMSAANSGHLRLSRPDGLPGLPQRLYLDGQARHADHANRRAGRDTRTSRASRPRLLAQPHDPRRREVAFDDPRHARLDPLLRDRGVARSKG